jgi:hypothetical protein
MRLKSRHKSLVPLQELQARRLAADRDHTTETQQAGAGLPQLPRHSLEGAIERLTQLAVSTHTSLGTLQEAAVSIRGEVKPEDVASQSKVVTETTEEGSRAAAEVVPGAAGNHAAATLFESKCEPYFFWPIPS